VGSSGLIPEEEAEGIKRKSSEKGSHPNTKGVDTTKEPSTLLRFQHSMPKNQSKDSQNPPTISFEPLTKNCMSECTL